MPINHSTTNTIWYLQNTLELNLHVSSNLQTSDHSKEIYHGSTLRKTGPISGPPLVFSQQRAWFPHRIEYRRKQGKEALKHSQYIPWNKCTLDENYTVDPGIEPRNSWWVFHRGQQMEKLKIPQIKTLSHFHFYLLSH